MGLITSYARGWMRSFIWKVVPKAKKEKKNKNEYESKDSIYKEFSEHSHKTSDLFQKSKNG